MSAEWKESGCNFCAVGCGLEVLVEDDHILDVRPSKNNVRTPGGYCCRKGRSSKYFLENPNRIDYPLKRVNGEFVRISWEQAIREIGEKARKILDEHGPRAFAFSGGALANDQSEIAAMMFIMDAIGTHYIYNPAGIEFSGNWWSHGRILGTQSAFTEPDHNNIETLVFWGSNSYVAHNIGPSRPIIREFSENPDKHLVVVDPRLSETARMADMHIIPKRGSDSALVRGLIALILDKGWQDQAFLDVWSADWDKAKKWYEGFDYREAFEFCGVPYEQMEDFARIITTTTWGIHQDLGIFCGKDSTLSSFLLVTLSAVTGNLLYKGNVESDTFLPSPEYDERRKRAWKTVETGRDRVSVSYPSAVLSQEMLSEKEDRLRCVFVSKNNPVGSFPDTDQMIKGFENLELSVCIEIVMSDTARHCDYVLPGKTGFEEPQFSVFNYQYPNVIGYLKQPVISQIGERREGSKILIDIAHAMGLVPELPQSLHEAAARSIEDRDLMPFMIKAFAWFGAHPKYINILPLIMTDLLGEAFDSVVIAVMRLAFAIAPMGATDIPGRAGFEALKSYRLLNKTNLTKFLAGVSAMDQAFWAVYDNPAGAVIGYSNPDPEEYTKEHIAYKDKKMRLYDEDIDRFIHMATVESLRERIGATEEFPMVLSSGNHGNDGGDNTSMKNPGTYKYRKPFTMFLNPEDAERLGLKDKDTAVIHTSTGAFRAPVELSFKTAPGYCVVPHNFGIENGSPKYGEMSNRMISWDNNDVITGNPAIRFVPCRVEKAQL